jgi:hypothetical protein
MYAWGANELACRVHPSWNHLVTTHPLLLQHVDISDMINIPGDVARQLIRRSGRRLLSLTFRLSMALPNTRSGLSTSSIVGASSIAIPTLVNAIRSCQPQPLYHITIKGHITVGIGHLLVLQPKRLIINDCTCYYKQFPRPASMIPSSIIMHGPTTVEWCAIAFAPPNCGCSTFRSLLRPPITTPTTTTTATTTVTIDPEIVRICRGCGHGWCWQCYTNAFQPFEACFTPQCRTCSKNPLMC